MIPPLLRVRSLSADYQLQSGAKREVLRDVSFEIQAGETLGLVGESGCGKTTLARCLGLLQPIRHGQIVLAGRDVTPLPTRELLAYRKQVQILFQDPASGLNPALRVRDLLEEPLILHSPQLTPTERMTRVREWLARVGLDDSSLERTPNEFSGGQRQRLCLARVLAVEPRLLILDEPVSSLDPILRQQILKLLRIEQKRSSMSLLFIAHDLRVVRDFCDRVAVMQSGRLIECRTTSELFRSPEHPHVRELLSAIPGQIPSENAPN